LRDRRGKSARIAERQQTQVASAKEEAAPEASEG
jgi:hypothetical protein